MSVVVRIRDGMEPSGGNGGASEGDLRGNHTDIIENSGVVDLAGGHGLVHQAASPAMTVVIDAGVVYIPNTIFDELDSDSVKFWEAVVAGTTGSRTKTIGANSSGQTRIDLVCVKIDPGMTPDEFADDVATLIIVAGTPGAGVPATPSFHEVLAKVTVANGATEIVNANITDLREQVVFNPDFLGLDTDDTLAANSDSKIASQKAVKSYVDEINQVTFNRQDLTTNSAEQGLHIQTGWSFILGDGASTNLTKAITFPVAFSSPPILLISKIGAKASVDPDSIDDFNSAPSGSDQNFTAGFASLTDSGFTAFINRTDLLALTAYRYGFSWIAIGPVA